MCVYPYEEMSASFDGDNHRDHGFCSRVQILGLWSTRVCYRLLVFEEASVHDLYPLIQMTIKLATIPSIGEIDPVTKACMAFCTIDVRGDAYQASEIANDHHTCDHRDHFAKERDDERIPKEISHSDTEAP
jgi:hypothetical protein